jgi:hypothetical protein
MFLLLTNLSTGDRENGKIFRNKLGKTIDAGAVPFHVSVFSRIRICP